MDVLVKDVKKESLWNMMFADDVVLCEQSIDRVEEKLEDWRKALKERGMKINRTKSEYLALKDVQMRSCKFQDDELKSMFDLCHRYIAKVTCSYHSTVPCGEFRNFLSCSRKANAASIDLPRIGDRFRRFDDLPDPSAVSF
ncbi:uncharacterized protein LOC124606187 [Schistocerca americana]|uniref:uncharacterized protein LOC124606187 n=1 Tax=Schistocerca americana TaxID=7009 RepID=UPI001F4F22E0|nr:uncharacterized protein LOC124606187 [Schistocerca americana]